MGNRPGIILQARLGSTRLPRKALQPIRGRAILELCLARLLAAGDAPVVLATTTNAEDDLLAMAAERLGVPCFRGDEQDVLGRYVAAASHFGFDPVIRATGDNPAVDMDATWRVLRGLARTGADYVNEEGLPVGAAVEGITYTALRACADAARSSYDREHVTTFVKRHTERFRVSTTPAPQALRYPNLRLTVDTPADLAHVRALFARVETPLATLRRLIEAAQVDVAGEVAA